MHDMMRLFIKCNMRAQRTQPEAMNIERRIVVHVLVGCTLILCVLAMEKLNTKATFWNKSNGKTQTNVPITQLKPKQSPMMSKFCVFLAS